MVADTDAASEARLDDLDELVSLLRREWRTLRWDEPDNVVTAGSLHCPSCGDARRMHITLTYSPPEIIDPDEDVAEQIVPTLLLFQCVQCRGEFTALIYECPDGPALMVLPKRRGSLSTPHTPQAVAYYLDQAQRAQSAGAASAAIAMFRSALERLLYEQGYQAGTAALQVAQLLADVEDRTAPGWARDLDADFLTIIKELAGGRAHLTNGDVQAQADDDEDLLTGMADTFAMLLFLVYEVPSEKSRRLAALRAKAQLLAR